MGFGKLLEEISPDASIKKIVQAHYGRERTQEPPTLKSFYYRASGFANVCPRQEVLMAQHGVGASRVQSADEIWNYDIGTGMHHALQNLILPAANLIVGCWQCLECGRRSGEAQEGQSVLEAAVLRPGTCESCGTSDFLYREYALQDREYGTGGHMDGILQVPKVSSRGILEIKSISGNGARKVREVPQMDHVIQLHIYMWLSGATWGRIIYLDKSVFGIEKGWIEHQVERDVETIDRIKGELVSIRRGLETGEIPKKVCLHRSCEKAQSCPVLAQCFGDPEPDNAVGLI